MSETRRLTEPATARAEIARVLHAVDAALEA